jgi:hypothetical protein
LEGKTEIVGGRPMTPEEAQENKRQLEEEQKKLTDPPKDRNVPPDSQVNQQPQPSHPETLRSAEAVQGQACRYR